MSRWIDAEWLKELYKPFENKKYSVPIGAILANIDDAPSIEIIRCRECKYAEVSVSPITGLWCIRFGINDMAMEADDFCSYGKPKEELNGSERLVKGSEKPNNSTAEDVGKE